MIVERRRHLEVAVAAWGRERWLEEKGNITHL